MRMISRWKPAVATAAMLLTLSAPAFAADEPEVKPILISAPAPGNEVLQPVPAADGTISLEGVVEYQDLEGGMYMIGGWGLIGDQALIKSLEGKQVIARGKEFTGMSIHMVKQIEVESLLQSVPANRSLPTALTVGGKAAGYDVAPFVQDGVLMLPLRAVVEAAGGSVAWDGDTWTVTVTMPDRMTWVAVGQDKAEMNENNVRYIQRNMLKMEKAPVIKEGRTFISADAATSILGLGEKLQGGAGLDLAFMK